MVASAVLGAAAGTGLALVVALTIILYHYYLVRRRNKDWGDPERFEGKAPHPSSSTPSCCGLGGLGYKRSTTPSEHHPSRASVQASEGGFGKCPYGCSRHGSRSSVASGSSNKDQHRHHHRHGHLGKIQRCDSRDSRSSTKSCPPLYTFPQQQFNFDQQQRIVQPLKCMTSSPPTTFAYNNTSSLPEVREASSTASLEDYYYFQEGPPPPPSTTSTGVMLTHQSRSLPPGPSSSLRLNRTPSVSSQGSQNEYGIRKVHRGSSPAIRTFTPEGVSSGTSPPDSPPLTYCGSRSPSPITYIHGGQQDTKGGRGPRSGSTSGGGGTTSPSPNSSTADLRISPLGESSSSRQSQSSLNSLCDRTNNHNHPLSLSTTTMGGGSALGLRRSSRCLSPLLITPKSPSPSDGSGQHTFAPLSPLLGTLQLDLYRKKDVTIFLPGSKQPGSEKSGQLDKNVPPLGKLHFELKYDFDKSDLHVHVVQATNLVVSSKGGFNDPYIRLFLSPEVDGRKRQTSIHRNEPNPFFDEHFKFPVSQDDLLEKILILQVFDYDRYSRNDVVGQVSFRLEEFSVTTNLEIWAEIIKNNAPSGEKQEILISLSYLPSAERLTVVLLKAQNLFPPPNKNNLDPFAKIYLTGGGKRLKKKKTTARKGTNNPVWNESVTFSISATSLENAAIEVHVLDQSNDLMGSDAFVGSCIIGPHEEGMELKHWQEMSQNYRKSIAMSHVLRKLS